MSDNRAEELIQCDKTELIRLLLELEKENKSLQRDSDLLNCLESWGVDNWQGYDDAKAEWRQLHNE